jgi:predicted acyltransferase
MLLVNDPGDWGHVYAPLEHSVWNGCTPTDLIFPFFLFVMGVSVALGIVPRAERRSENRLLRNAATWRALRILLLGIAINLLAWCLWPDAHLRVPGVLQRIGLCFAGTAMFAIYSRPPIWLGSAGLLLLGYWLVMVAGGSLAPWDNIASRIDSVVFGSAVYLTDPLTGRGHDPEGLLGTLPSLATALLGLYAGHRLRQGERKTLLLVGGLAVALALVWSTWLPFNKNLWTSSFALWCAGWAMLALLIFHWLVDEHRMPAWGRRFGVNAIAAYAGSELMQILLHALGWQAPLYHHLFASWITPLAGPTAASLAYAIAFVALWWLIVYLLDRQRVYLTL